MAQEVIDILTSNIDTLWVIDCAILVFIMQAGFMCMETGLSRHKKFCILIESKENIDENIVETNYNLNNQLILSNESILKILHDNKELKDVISNLKEFDGPSLR